MRHYRTPKKYLRPKKQPKTCQMCGKQTEELYQYIDESNIAITYNSPFLCEKCYQTKYESRRK